MLIWSLLKVVSFLQCVYQFVYVKYKLCLLQFLEQKKALKEEGRNDKELAENFAFYCVDTETEVSMILK